MSLGYCVCNSRGFIFSLEVVSVGILYYAALVPTVIASLVGAAVAKHWGVHAEHFTILEVPEFTLTPALKIIVLAMLCAGVSKLFCLILHKSGELFREKIENPYLRVVVAGVIVILLTILVQSTDYMGAGVHVIERAMNGEVRPEAFLLKMILEHLRMQKKHFHSILSVMLLERQRR